MSQNPIAALCLMPSNAEDWENQGAGSVTNSKKGGSGKKKMRLSEAQDQLSAWTRVIDQWGEITYVNSLTKIAKRLLPDSVCLAGRDAVIAQWDRGDYSRLQPELPAPIGLVWTGLST